MERAHIFVFTFILIFFSNERANPKTKESIWCGVILMKLYTHPSYTNRFRIEIWLEACNWISKTIKTAISAIKSRLRLSRQRKKQHFRKEISDDRIWLLGSLLMKIMMPQNSFWRSWPIKTYNVFFSIRPYFSMTKVSTSLSLHAFLLDAFHYLFFS